jgi:ABC-2 type transport system permease protein
VSYEVEVTMPALVRTELLALRTIRTPWALAAVAVLLTLVLAVTPVFNAGKPGAHSIGTPGALLAVLGALGAGRVVVLLIGVFSVTAEFRHDTATATFLRTARRARVLVARAMTAVLVAAVVAVADLAVVLAVGVPSGAVQPSMLNGDIVLRVLGLVLAYPLYGLVGVGLGALIVHQPVAVALLLAWVLLVEDLVLHLLPRAVTPWSLGGVTAALAHAGDVPRVLPVPVGGGALLGYGLLLLALGAVRVVRRDIT